MKTLKTTLRLLVTENCNKDCSGCCNKQNQFANIESLNLGLSHRSNWDYLRSFKEILLTGGEPMLYPESLKDIIFNIRTYHPSVKIYLYTAFIPGPVIMDILNLVDGITLTLHDLDDREGFFAFSKTLANNPLYLLNKSMRLNIFKEAYIMDYYVDDDLFSLYDFGEKIWDKKHKLKWIENCPLPDHEEIRKLI